MGDGEKSDFNRTCTFFFSLTPVFFYWLVGMIFPSFFLIYPGGLRIGKCGAHQYEIG